MMRHRPPPPLRQELRPLIEHHSIALPLYGALFRRYCHLEDSELLRLLQDDVSNDLRQFVRDRLPDLPTPALTLEARSSLCSLISQTTPDEELLLGVVLLEYFALQLEPYIQAGLIDPTQRRILAPALEREQLTNRPIELMIAVAQQLPASLPAAASAC